MTTVLEIVDSVVKIGLGAAISAVASYRVAQRAHSHERQKSASEDRRSLLRSLAKLLEEATAALNLATYGLEHEQESRAAARRLLIDSINKLGEAKSLAVLAGARQLRGEIELLRSGIEQLAGHFLSVGETYSIREANRLIAKINESWPKVYDELEKVYEQTSRAE